MLSGPFGRIWTRINPKLSDKLYSPLAIFLNPFSWFLIFVELFFFSFAFLGILNFLSFLKTTRNFVNDLIYTDVLDEEQSLWDLLFQSIQKNSSKIAMKRRKYLYKRDMFDKRTQKTLNKLVFAQEIQEIAYAELYDEVRSMGSGLRLLGLEPHPPWDEDRIYSAYIQDAEPVGKEVVMIYEDACFEFTVTAMACLGYSYVLATSYATLGIPNLVTALNRTGARILVLNLKMLDQVLPAVQECPNLTTLIYTTNYCSLAQIQAYSPEFMEGRLRIVYFEKVTDLGNLAPFPPRPPHPEQVALIMYTSGSSGDPKGVVITHKALNHSVVSIVTSLSTRHMTNDEVQRASMSIFDFVDGYNYIAYLPPAHILEFVAEFQCLTTGGCLFYADHRTLTNSGCVVLPASSSNIGAYSDLETESNLFQDVEASASIQYIDHPGIGALQLASPYGFTGVPLVYSELQRIIESYVTDCWIRYFLSVAVYFRYYFLTTLKFSFLHWTVFKKLHDRFGGNLKCFLSGGGPLDASNMDFIRCCFPQAGVVQGYGLTESVGAAALQSPFDQSTGVVGYPVKSVEIMLVSLPDVSDENGNPYLVTDRKDKENLPIWGRGEIWIRGPSMSLGYFKNEEATTDVYYQKNPKEEEAFILTGRLGASVGAQMAQSKFRHKPYFPQLGTSIGFPFVHHATDSDTPYEGFKWFKTGDVGMFTDKGSLKIVDRVKSIVKLKTGEYVAIAKMETLFSQCSLINNINGGVMVYASGDLKRCMAFAQVFEEDFQAKGRERLEKEVLAALDALGKTAQLPKNEFLAAVTVIPGTGSAEQELSPTSPWTPENGGLTHSHKLSRLAIAKAFKEAIEAEVAKQNV